jgi:hypothetical protein
VPLRGCSESLCCYEELYQVAVKTVCLYEVRIDFFDFLCYILSVFDKG